MNLLIELLIIGLINCMAIIGFHLAVQFRYTEYAYFPPMPVKETKNILWFIKYFGDNHLSAFWRKPIYDCPRCMASIHSTYVYFPLVPLLKLNDYLPTFIVSPDIYLYPVYILFLSGLIEIVTRKFEI